MCSVEDVLRKDLGSYGRCILKLITVIASNVIDQILEGTTSGTKHLWITSVVQKMENCV